jgi:hypothetical protein
MIRGYRSSRALRPRRSEAGGQFVAPRWSAVRFQSSRSPPAIQQLRAAACSRRASEGGADRSIDWRQDGVCRADTDIDACAGGLVARGLRPRDIVAICGFNTSVGSLASVWGPGARWAEAISRPERVAWGIRQLPQGGSTSKPGPAAPGPTPRPGRSHVGCSEPAHGPARRSPLTRRT